MYSPILHQKLYQNIFKCFSNFIPLKTVPNMLNEKDIDVLFGEIVNKKSLKTQILEEKYMNQQKNLKNPRNLIQIIQLFFFLMTQQKRMIFTFKQCSKDPDIVTCLFS